MIFVQMKLGVDSAIKRKQTDLCFCWTDPETSYHFLYEIQHRIKVSAAHTARGIKNEYYVSRFSSVASCKINNK